MEFSIPNISGGSLPITLDHGDRLFVIGANGSGKSALIQHLVSLYPNDRTIKRISAHRQTWFDWQDGNFNPRNRRNFEQQYDQIQTQLDARWREHGQYASWRPLAVLFNLADKEVDRAIKVTHHIDVQNPPKAESVAAETASPFAQINELFRVANLMISLKLSNGKDILAHHSNGDTAFSIEKMSDGERNAALIAAEVLTVEPGTIMLIDEPERHLHRSIIEPFLSALFELRKDCAFVVSTHEIALPVANPEARVLIVRSCEWNGDNADKWDAHLLEANMPLPEELKRDILGARQKILFVEGTSDSLDQPLYSALFPDISVVPKGSCGEVENAVRGLRESQNLHHAKVYGLIDRDDRSDDGIEKLAENNVFALGVYSVEGLYYCSDAIHAVASLQAKPRGCSTTEIFEITQQKALDALSKDSVAKMMAARRCERRVRNLLLSQLPDWQQIKYNKTLSITADVSALYDEELEYFNKLVSEKELDELIARYPLHKSQVFDIMAKVLKCQNKEDYEQIVRAQVIEDKCLAQKLKSRIHPLSEALVQEDKVEALSVP